MAHNIVLPNLIGIIFVSLERVRISCKKLTCGEIYPSQIITSFSQRYIHFTITILYPHFQLTCVCLASSKIRNSMFFLYTSARAVSLGVLCWRMARSFHQSPEFSSRAPISGSNTAGLSLASPNTASKPNRPLRTYVVHMYTTVCCSCNPWKTLCNTVQCWSLGSIFHEFTLH